MVGGAVLIVPLFILTLVAIISILQGAFAFSKKSPLRTASVLGGLEYLMLIAIILKNSRHVPVSDTLGSIVKFTAGTVLLFVALPILRSLLSLW